MKAQPSPLALAVRALGASIDRLTEARRATYRQAWIWGFTCGVFWALAALALARTFYPSLSFL